MSYTDSVELREPYWGRRGAGRTSHTDPDDPREPYWGRRGRDE